MKVETFFEKFELFAEAPGAVARMRELVLDSAIAGNFCHNTAAKWETCELADIIELISGQHLLSHEQNSEGRGVPYLTGPSDFGKKYPTPSRWTEEPKVLAKVGDILITVKGSGIGKTNVLISEPTAISRQLMAVRVTDADPEFIHIVLKRAASHFQEAQTGIAIPGIGRSDVLNLKITRPPIAEQKRIVAKVEELMTLCDRLETQQHEREERYESLSRASLDRFSEAPTPANLNFIFHKSYDVSPAELRKAILTLAVQGKLVPQDPHDGSANALIEKIENDRSKFELAGTIRISKPCRKFGQDEVPYEIPENWIWTMLGEITDIGTGSTPSRTESTFWKNGTIPWITSGSTSHSPISEADEFVTSAAIKAHRLRIYKKNTLLVALYGQGKTRGQVAFLAIEAAINQACAAICPINGFESTQDYIKLLLDKQYDEMRLLAAGGAQPNLNVQKIKELFVPLPPIAEQRRIVTRVNQLMTLVDLLESQLAESRSAGKNLLEALVSELAA